jgi:hypothetical protein
VTNDTLGRCDVMMMNDCGSYISILALSGLHSWGSKGHTVLGYQIVCMYVGFDL